MSILNYNYPTKTVLPKIFLYDLLCYITICYCDKTMFIILVNMLNINVYTFLLILKYVCHFTQPYA